MKINRQYFLLCFVALMTITFFSCQNSTKKNTIITQSHDWHYFGQTPPGKMPELFLPEIISTRRDERDITISPYGSEIYYTLVLPSDKVSVILYLRFDGAFWSEPEVAYFSGVYNDLEPSFSPDGNRVYFVSDRPLVKDGESADYNIWYVEKGTNGWSDPVPAGEPVNTKNDEFYPSVSKGGKLFFTSKRSDSFGGDDIYFSQMVNGVFAEPVNTGNRINSAFDDFNAYIAPDESYLIFSSLGRDDDTGGGDLYISYNVNDTLWTSAKNMGSRVNSNELDYCPFVTFDNKYLFFTSNRSNPNLNSHYPKRFKTILNLADGIDNGLGNIYWMKFDAGTKNIK